MLAGARLGQGTGLFRRALGIGGHDEGPHVHNGDGAKRRFASIALDRLLLGLSGRVRDTQRPEGCFARETALAREFAFAIVSSE